MKIKNQLSIIIITIALPLLMLSCNNNVKQSVESNNSMEDMHTETDIERGEYLVSIMGCNDCHSPKRMGERGPEIIPELMLSGYPSDRPVVKFDNELIKQGFGVFYPDLTGAAGPWGISFAANITPDQTGIGNWSEEQFVKAMTQGKFKGLDNGRMLLPPMPWFNYINIKDADIHAIFAYLKSINPVKNIVPPPVSPDNM